MSFLKNWRKYLCECLGTMMLTLVACGVAVVSRGNLVATSLAFGLVIVAMAFSIGHISGCHINPAVSVAMFLRKKITAKEFGFYVASQFVGALIGTTILVLILGGKWFNTDLNYFTIGELGLGQNQIQPNLMKLSEVGPYVTFGSHIAAFFVELILTFVFVLTILTVTDEKHGAGKFAPIVIGLVLTLVHLMGIPLTGTSVNPARSFAPGFFYLFSGYNDATSSMSQMWIWQLAPMAGGACAALFYGMINKEGLGIFAKKAAAPKAEEKPAEEKTEEKPAE